MNKMFEFIGITVFAFCILAVLQAWPVQLLWNWLMPDIFGLKAITFWQAMGISLLTSLLFGKTIRQKKE